jgi:Na+(H+)/acetate symporter ActP
MITIKIISMVWALIMSFYALIAKLSGVSPLMVMLIKALSLISLIYFGSELFKIIP